MTKLLQINVTANWGSTGRIAEDIGNLAISEGWESWIAYGRGSPTSSSKLYRIGSDFDMRCHALQSRIFDNHGLASVGATRKFVDFIKTLNPDIVHLHNIHGYFVNYKILMECLAELDVPVIWTLHDCWSFTGHCAHFEDAKCERWKRECRNCPALSQYPKSLFIDRSTQNYRDKRSAFCGLNNLTLFPVSDWLRSLLKSSFLKDKRAITFHNGIDLNKFKPNLKAKNEVRKKYDILPSQKLLLGVASVWDRKKGLDEFVKLHSQLDSESYKIILVGLSPKQIKSLPKGIIGISRTENLEELIYLYSAADVFVNPTLEDTFPTTNLEALACGTPIATYRTGGSPEAVSDDTGRVVEKYDIDGLVKAIVDLCGLDRINLSYACRMRAEENFDKNDCFKRYIEMYKEIIYAKRHVEKYTDSIFSKDILRI